MVKAEMAKQVNLIDKLVGNRVKTLRNTSGVSLQEAALLIDSSLTDYQQLEAGDLRFKARQLMALAYRFGVPGSAFFVDIELPGSRDHRHTNAATAFSVLH